MDPLVPPGIDPAHDVLNYTHKALDTIFAPKSVAVVGATETQGSVGRTILWNLISSSFGGTIYPINPSAPACWESKPIHPSRTCLRWWT